MLIDVEHLTSKERIALIIAAEAAIAAIETGNREHAN